MASYMHDLVVNKTKTIVEVAKFISLSYDEVTTFDQQSWVCIDAYVVENWQQIPLLLSSQQVVDGATSNNLKHILVDAMVLFGDLNKDNIAYKLITFGVGGVSVFQGIRIGVIDHLKN